MAQLSDDCFAFGGAMLSLAQAEARVAELYGCVVGHHSLPMAEACGAILAADIHAPMNLPPETNSAVDGYALHHADLAPDRPTTLPLAARIAAGHAPLAAIPRGQAGRIFTGAVMPVDGGVSMGF